MRWLRAGDAELAPCDDPARAALRLAELPERARSLRSAELRRTREVLDDHGVAAAARGTAPAHLTGSAIVVDAARRRVLLLHHAKLRR